MGVAFVQDFGSLLRVAGKCVKRNKTKEMENATKKEKEKENRSTTDPKRWNELRSGTDEERGIKQSQRRSQKHWTTHGVKSV